MAFARRFEELVVYQIAFRVAGQIFQATKSWPVEEKFGLTSQIRNSSRSVCGNIAEAWRKRRYPNHFVSKLTDADGETAETQNWLKFAVECGYMEGDAARELYLEYDRVSAGLVDMMSAPQKWCGPAQLVREEHVAYADKPSLRSQSLSSEAECIRRRSRLFEPHMSPLAELVVNLRCAHDKSAEDVPDFDPEDAGVNALALLLLQDPGAKASKTGFISRDNPDFTAQCLNEVLREAGLTRELYAIWNLVPWRNARYPDDVEAGRHALSDIVELMPKLKVVITLGEHAARGVGGACEFLPRDTAVLNAPHPSPLNVRTRPESRTRIVEVLTKAARHIRTV